MRDYKKLRAFELADELALAVYRCTQDFPKEERFGLTSQMRRCAVSIPSNIAEGCGRTPRVDYLRFLDIAYGSACELEYQISLAMRLGFFEEMSGSDLSRKCSATARTLNALINSLKKTGVPTPKPDSLPPPKPDPRNLTPAPRSGMVLLVVVVVVALLALAGVAFVALMTSELDTTRQRSREIQMQYITQSGVSLVESVAGRSDFERKQVGGTYDNASLFCAVPLARDVSDLYPSARVTVVSPKLDNGRMAGIRYGLANESAKLHLAKVLEWETANPGDGVAALRRLPGMTAQTAEAILDWIDPDNDPRISGAEAAYYAQMRLPYKPRNAVPVTLEEFLLVRGVTRQLVFGDDENFNFVPDPQEARMAAQNQSVNLPDAFNNNIAGSSVAGGNIGGSVGPTIPWVHLLTVTSAERDANPRGAARIDLNHANLEFLHAQLIERVNRETADFVILYRQFGPAPIADSAQTDTTQTNVPSPNTAQTNVPSPDATQANMPPADTAQTDVPSTDAAQTSALSSDTSSAMTSAASSMSATTPAASSALVSTTTSQMSTSTATTAATPTTRNRSTGNRSTGERTAGNRSAGNRSTRRGRQTGFSDYVDLRTPAKFRFETPLDLINTSVVVPVSNVAQPMAQPPATTSIAAPQSPTVTLESPLFVNSSSLNSTLVAYLDEVSTSPSTTIIGRININEAPYEVIAAIPGLSQNAAQQIVNRREQSANGVRDMYRHATWLLAFDVVDLETLKQLWPHITCGGDVFRGQVVGFYEDIGTFSRVETTIDATVFPPRRINYKDLSSYGIGFHDRVLFGTIPGQGNAGSMVQPGAPTLSDSGTGTSLADWGADSYSGMSGFDSGAGTPGMLPFDQGFAQPTPYSEVAPLDVPLD